MECAGEVAEFSRREQQGDRLLQVAFVDASAAAPPATSDTLNYVNSLACAGYARTDPDAIVREYAHLGGEVTHEQRRQLLLRALELEPDHATVRAALARLEVR